MYTSTPKTSASDIMATLRLFRGSPGAGKSSAAKRMFPNVLLLENDQIMMQDNHYNWSKERVKEAIAWCTQMTRVALENNMDVCVANTFTKKRYVAAYEKIANECGAKFEVYRCTGNFKNVHGLSDVMVHNFKNAMEDWPGEIEVGPNA